MKTKLLALMGALMLLGMFTGCEQPTSNRPSATIQYSAEPYVVYYKHKMGEGKYVYYLKLPDADMGEIEKSFRLETDHGDLEIGSQVVLMPKPQFNPMSILQMAPMNPNSGQNEVKPTPKSETSNNRYKTGEYL